MKNPNVGRVTVCLIGFFAVSLILAAGAVSSLLAFMPAAPERRIAEIPHASKQDLPPDSAAAHGGRRQPAAVAGATQEQVAQKNISRPAEAASQIRFERPVEIPTQYGPPEWAAQQQRYEVLLAGERQKLEELKKRYGQEHPDVVRLSRLIADLEVQKEELAKRHARLLAILGPKLGGYVYDPAGTAVPGVGVSLVDADSRRILVLAESDAQGHFEIDTFVGLAFELRFASPGFAPLVLASRDLGTRPLQVTLELDEVKETVAIITGAAAGTAAPATGAPARTHVVRPKLSRRVDPVYPPQAKLDNVEGAVVVSAIIDAEGQVKDAVVLSGHPMLKEAALESVLQWRYSPALLNGEPWPMRLSITLVFKLDR